MDFCDPQPLSCILLVETNLLGISGVKQSLGGAKTGDPMHTVPIGLLSALSYAQEGQNPS